MPLQQISTQACGKRIGCYKLLTLKTSISLHKDYYYTFFFQQHIF